MSGYYFSCSCVLLGALSLCALNYVHYEEEPSSPEGRKSLDQSTRQSRSDVGVDGAENGGPVCLCPSKLHNAKQVSYTYHG
jgi:hypothetical protein